MALTSPLDPDDAFHIARMVEGIKENHLDEPTAARVLAITQKALALIPTTTAAPVAT